MAILAGFGTGKLGDHGLHSIDPVYWALDLGMPETIEAETDAGWDTVNDKTRIFPRFSVVRYGFPARQEARHDAHLASQRQDAARRANGVPTEVLPQALAIVHSAAQEGAPFPLECAGGFWHRVRTGSGSPWQNGIAERGVAPRCQAGAAGEDTPLWAA
jgi:hypothetical protein